MVKLIIYPTGLEGHVVINNPSTTEILDYIRSLDVHHNTMLQLSSDKHIPNYDHPSEIIRL